MRLEVVRPMSKSQKSASKAFQYEVRCDGREMVVSPYSIFCHPPDMDFECHWGLNGTESAWLAASAFWALVLKTHHFAEICLCKTCDLGAIIRKFPERSRQCTVSKAPMPYEASIDVVQILRSTLYLLEHADYPQKGSSAIAAIVAHLRLTIAELEGGAKRPPEGEGRGDDALRARQEKQIG